MVPTEGTVMLFVSLHWAAFPQLPSWFLSGSLCLCAYPHTPLPSTHGRSGSPARIGTGCYSRRRKADCGILTVEEASKEREIPDLMSWVQCFETYVSVLREKFPSLTRASGRTRSSW